MKPTISAEERRVAWLVARFITGKISEGEEEELDRWILGKDENMVLFEQLTDENEIDNNKEWFGERGINPFSLKQKRVEWYDPVRNRKERREFWIGMAIGALGLAFVYYVLHYL